MPYFSAIFAVSITASRGLGNHQSPSPQARGDRSRWTMVAGHRALKPTLQARRNRVTAFGIFETLVPPPENAC
jgi:hypothetical protein